MAATMRNQSIANLQIPFSAPGFFSQSHSYLNSTLTPRGPCSSESTASVAQDSFDSEFAMYVRWLGFRQGWPLIKAEGTSNSDKARENEPYGVDGSNFTLLPSAHDS